MNPSNADIRQFILDAFSDDDFEVFCTDYFRDALAEFSSGMALRIRALRLIEYCQRREVMDNLLSALQKERPQLYAGRLAQGKPPDVRVIGSPIHLELARVPAGEFVMGSDHAKYEAAEGWDEHWEDELPEHRVYISEFYIGKSPVTNQQYAVYAQANKVEFSAPEGKDNHPVVDVTWEDALTFCQWLSEASGQKVLLPTETEWEKAARGTAERIYPWGDPWDATKANTQEGGLNDTTAAGRYSPPGDSPYGLVDMAGNVWEWCWDWHNKTEYEEHARSRSPVKDPTGPATGSSRVLRGGSWEFAQGFARCSYRYASEPDVSDHDLGFRVVVRLDAAP